MPSRIVREGILTSEPVNACSWAAEVLYRRLMSVVDDFGRYYAKEALIRGACYPLKLEKVSDSDIGKWLTECVNAALIRVYPASDGKRYLEIMKFGVPRAKKSRFPDPCEQTQASENECTQVNATVPYSGSNSNSNSESESARSALAAAPPPPGVQEENWKAWVKHKGKKHTAEADRLQRKHLAEWTVQGHDPNRIVENAVSGGWLGLREPEAPKANGKNGHGGAWWDSEQGIIAKGKELDMAPFGGEGWPEFKARINARLRATRAS